ncbi:DUF3267 domain-containing protein [Ureibacillus terrenus]|uniref:DUF3267 domain-containing protein n=1 Tax=Ureibacillus terrenus TaxID=118246 RepID=A0A540V209_9BACL|nr:DUF3267 domain-containing protein [Ureibacillus terrenus]MED3763352.1 DUF3267 domain-containing protein [Ureibacillus terrenus]TQE90766.1 DUF3267 domain-containing protein [Ureibacillus terrenus]
MHCWKTLNIKSEYRITRLVLYSVIIFVLVFSFSFVFVNINRPIQYEEGNFLLFLLILLLIYPLHKIIHYYSLFSYRKSVKLKWKLELKFIPIVHIRIKKMIPKKRYMFILITPFIVLNILLLSAAILLPQYSHYACILLGYHCSICLVDILFFINLVNAPKNAVIEETPKGYEILIPPEKFKNF